MALPLLARAIGGSLVKGAAKKAIGGRKKKINPAMMIPGGGSNGGGGGAIIKSKIVSVPASAIVPVKKSPNVETGTGSGIVGILETIRANVRQIDDFYKGTVAAKREEIKKRKKQDSDERKAEQEASLEKPKIDKKPKMNLKGLKMPKTGILDGIFKFISTVLMGMLVMKLIDFADTLAKTGILTTLGKIGDFVIDVGGKILDGLVTFIDKAYDFYDGLRESIGDNFGEGAQEQFDNLSGTLNKVLNTVFSVGLAISLLAGAIPQEKPKPKAKTPKPKPKTKVDTKLKNMGLDDDQIKAYNKARQGGASATDALKQARRVKPKPKPKGFFGRLGAGFQAAGEGLTKFGQGAVDLGVSGLKAIGGGLNKISGGNLGKLGNFLGEQYQNVSKGARAAFDRVANLGNSLKSKFGSAMESVKGAVGNMAESAKKAVMQKIVEPLKPFLDPVIDKAKKIGDKVIGILKKIPGFDNVLQVLKKKGINSIGDAAGILKKVGSKALPIIGGLFNLLFAYDRLAGGDSFGALLELLSAGLDISGLFGFVPGPGISMGIDAYMFARDFVPLIQEGEEKAINAIGLGGLKSNLDQLGSKLPDLGTIVKMFKGEDAEQKSAAEIASTTGDTTTTDGSTPAPAASASTTPAGQPATRDFSNVESNIQGSNKEKWKAVTSLGQQAGAKYPQLVAAQFALESAWGTALSAKNNFFGIKATANEDATTSATTEVYGGQTVNIDARFKNFDTPFDAVNHLVTQWYKDFKGYKGVNNASDKFAAAQMLKSEGYATDPVYAESLTRLMNEYNVAKFEGGGYVGGKYNMKSIQRRASYEGGEQMISIPIPMPQQPNIQQPETSMMGPVSAVSSDDPFEFLEFQG